MHKKLAVCVDDLLFNSKISRTARSLFIEIEFIPGSSEKIMERIQLLNPMAVVLDLNSKKMHPIMLIQTLKRDPATSQIPIIGFFSHVDTDTRLAAMSSGCDQVVPRSLFEQKLPEILSAL